MSDAAPRDLVVEPSPGETRDPLVRAEIKKATVWFSIAGAIALVVLLVQPLLIIFGGLVFAAMLDGGVRLLGRVTKLGRGWRLAIIMVSAVLLVVGTVYLAGVQITVQAQQLQDTLIAQGNRLAAWAQSKGIMPGRADLGGLAREALGSVGRITSFVGTAFGAFTTLFLIVVLGLFIAAEPRLYERGLQWMIPLDSRRDFTVTVERMGTTLRRLLAGRLLGMALEGVLTFVILIVLGVPMALVLGIIAAMLAFIPNIGAFITGVLMVAVGLSASVDKGIAAFATYLVVQTFDGYVVLPMVARKTVDVPPALTLGAQLLASTLFGVLGLALADPMVAMIKVALERKSEQAAKDGFGEGSV